jgi:putative membrane protein
MKTNPVMRISLVFPALAPVAAAHEVGASHAIAPVTWSTWSFEPGVVIGLALIAWLYARGLRRLRSMGRARRRFRREARYFSAGWIVLALALVSPLHPLGSELFSAHMLQHELLMVVAAPLLVLGRPPLVFFCALPKPVGRGALAVVRAGGGDHVWHWLIDPLPAWVLHTAVLWIWHVPALFEATLDSELMHAAQHISFLGAALLFWHALLRGRRRWMEAGTGVLYLFTTALQSGALGALITFSSRPWYPRYLATAPAWGFTGMQDQQLGGLIMWVPAGLVYVVAGLVIFARWLNESDRRRAAAVRTSAAGAAMRAGRNVERAPKRPVLR